MRYIEIDGRRYDVPCCYNCPCYDEEDSRYWECCKHPDGDGISAIGGGIWYDDKSDKRYGPECPLREKPEPVEGGVVDPCGIEMVFLGPLDNGKEIVIPEHILEVLGSLKVEHERPRRTRVMDDEQKVATIECEAMEKALAYMSELIGKIETAIENSEPIMQGIYLERLKHAIMTEYNDMIRRQVEARE